MRRGRGWVAGPTTLRPVGRHGGDHGFRGLGPGADAAQRDRLPRLVRLAVHGGGR
jgi:hypothetical protein